MYVYAYACYTCDSPILRMFTRHVTFRLGILFQIMYRLKRTGETIIDITILPSRVKVQKNKHRICFPRCVFTRNNIISNSEIPINSYTHISSRNIYRGYTIAFLCKRKSVSSAAFIAIILLLLLSLLLLLLLLRCCHNRVTKFH